MSSSLLDTTRSPRPGESDGREYHFVSKPTFEEMIAKDRFLEWAQFSGNLYGTSWDAIRAVQQAGRSCILDLELAGVKSLRALMTADPHGDLQVEAPPLFILVRPPSMSELRRRLLERGTETPESLAMRLERAERDVAVAEAHPELYDKTVVNDDFDQAYTDFCHCIFDARADTV